MANDDAAYWANLGTQSLQQDQAAQVRNSLSQALPVNPDKEAETRRIAAAAQVPLDTARAMPEQTKTQAQLTQFDADALVKKFPNTARWLGAPDNARLVHDDIPGTTKVEQAVTAMFKPPAPTDSGFSMSDALNYIFSKSDGRTLVGDAGGAAGEVVKGLGGAFNKAGQFLDTVAGAFPVLYDKMAGGTSAGDWWFRNTVDPLVKDAPVFATDKNDPFVHKAANASGALLGTLSQIVLTGGQSAPAAIPAAEGAVAAGKAALEHGTKAMAFPALSDSVNTGREVYAATNDPAAAWRAATAQWLATNAMGVVPLSAAGNLPVRLATGAASGMLAGETTRQGMNLALPDQMKQPFDWEQMFLSGVSGLMLGGVMGPRSEAAALAPGVRDAYRAAFDQAHAEAQNEKLVELAKAAAASKLRERDPEAFKQFVRDAADSGDMHGVYIEGSKLAETLQQAGVEPAELRAMMPEVAAQLDAALGVNAPKNGMVQIPIEDFATHIAGGKLEEPLMQHLRVDPEGGTLAESKAFQQSQIDDLKARAEKINATHEADKTYQDSVNKVQADLQQRLEAIGMKPEIATANAAPLAAFYQVHAERMGMLPHEFADQYPVKFSNAAMDGLAQDPRAFNQSAVIDERPITSQTRDRAGDKYDVSVSKKVFGADQRAPNSVLVEIHDPATGERRGFVDFSIRPDGVLTSEMTRVAPSLRGRGIAEAMYKAARDAGYDIAPGKVQTDMGAKMVERLQAKGLINKEAEGKRYSAGDLDLVPLNGDALAQDARGTFSPTSKTISVLKGADLSTFQHELGHFFLDTLAHLAARPDAPASVKADMQTLLKLVRHRKPRRLAPDVAR
jgi:predicted GNAT family acetyltransferase